MKNEDNCELKKGDRVVVYEDPVTKKIVEGHAELVRCEIPDREQEYWIVRFDGDTDTTERWINKSDM